LNLLRMLEKLVVFTSPIKSLVSKNRTARYPSPSTFCSLTRQRRHEAQTNGKTHLLKLIWLAALLAAVEADGAPDADSWDGEVEFCFCPEASADVSISISDALYL